MGIAHTFNEKIFRQIHGNSLVYNTCWEDPRCDRKLLNLNEKSRVVLLTSAGCNALDYLLDNPAEIRSAIRPDHTCSHPQGYIKSGAMFL